MTAEEAEESAYACVPCQRSRAAWTRFLALSLPGCTAPTSALPSTQVSDMCQEMEQQAELLAAARAAGLLRAGGAPSDGGGGDGGVWGTLVVLTLKCRLPHCARR